MKFHTSVKITRRMLEKLGACVDGVLDAPVPAMIYTDIEKNIPLALTLADSNRAHHGWDDPWWLMCQVLSQAERYSMLPDTSIERDLRDAWVIAQRLAAIADAIATKAGR